MENFRSALGTSESSNRYDVVNDEGFTGKYQFGPARLKDFMDATGSSFSMDEFRNNPALQEAVQAWHEQDIMDYVMDKGLDYYIGKEVGGVPITPSALMGMAHLGGKSGMRQFLETGGQYNPSDSNNTSLRDYGIKFSGAAAGEYAPTDTPSGDEGIMGLKEELQKDDESRKMDAALKILEGTMTRPRARPEAPSAAPMRSLRPQARPDPLRRFEGLGSLRDAL